MRDHVRLKRGFLTDQTGGKHGIEIVALCLSAELNFVGKRKEDLPNVGRHFAEFAGVETADGQASVGHAGGKVALIERGLRGLNQEARRSGSGEGSLEFEFRGSVKGNGAKGLGQIPAIENIWRNGLIEEAQ